jgi:long-chain acyl-CoA synthetase
MIKTEEEIKREIEEKKLTGIPSIDRPYRKFYTDEMLSLEVPQKSLTEYIYDKNKDRLYLNALSYLTTKVSYEELFGYFP